MPATTNESKVREANNPKIRIPDYLKTRIDRLSEELRESYMAGRVDLPAGINPETIPRWAVIVKALDELEAHRARAKKSRRNSKTAKATSINEI